jgi:hypothetical protein
MLRKNWSALGSFIARIARAPSTSRLPSQLVFNTFANQHLVGASTAPTSTSPTARARPQPRHGRLLLARPPPARGGYVPLADFARARPWRARRSHGCQGVDGASACPRTHSPSHIGLVPGVGGAQEAGIPIVFHVGGGGQLSRPHYFENGLPPVPDFHGGAENFRSVDYMAIPSRRCRRSPP